jgi:hypothetical protein
MLQVIGGGFGRTGTHSLGLALVKLGLGPCYNLPEVSKNPGHTQVWNDAVDGKPVDWDALFADYQSSVEWPAVAFLPELVAHYPEAKVVLTLRDPESWYESARATIFVGLELSAHNPDPVKRQQSWMQRRLILERTFRDRYWEKEYALEAYKQHQQNVIDLVPPERLLQYSVKDGWEPLCASLNLPVPDDPFPRLNVRTDFLSSAPDWAKKIMQERRNSPD